MPLYESVTSSHDSRYLYLSTLWSVNMLAYGKGKYINYIALGNEVKLSRQVKAEIDFTNRAVSGHTFLLKDCSVAAELSYMPTEKVNLFAKVSYDVNNTDNTVVHDSHCQRLEPLKVRKAP